MKGYSEVNALHLNIGPHKLLPGEVKYICLLSKNRVDSYIRWQSFSHYWLSK